ncbi:leucine-rich repeat domain-containing protein, partial [Ruminococcus sp.]|uniref:leucine-rich repeat domain-containing protein n=1 Tax=Ruminococcus sp. TaxID=41978 RepID=UPI0025FC615E
MKFWRQVLAAVSAAIVGFSGLQLPLAGGNLLCVSADELTDGLIFTVSGGEATVTDCTSTASEIVIPSEYEGYPVTAIGEKVFYDCDTLVSVTIPQGVTTLGDYAFGYCDNLTTIYMPVSVTSWGYGVSYDCLSLSDVYYEGTSTEWENIDQGEANGYLLNIATTHYNYVYPDGTGTSSGLTFTVSGGEATLTDCTSTASEIVIPSEYEGYPVTAIGENAFYDCDTLVSVTIPQGVTTLGDYAFGYCDNLTTIYMPVSVTSWGYGVSYDCLSLSDVYYEGTFTEWENIDQGEANGYLQNIATKHYNAYDTAGTQSVWSLGKMTVRPEDGMEEDLNFDICIKNAMDSYGIQGAIWLPEITARLLYWPYMADSALVGDVYNSARLTANMNKVLYNEGNEIYFALDSSSLMTPETDSGVLMQLTFSVPDEETVVALAEEYGLELETDEYGTYYYEFPVCWMENGYDEAISDGEIIELPHYAYVNSDNQDVFSDNVVLEDGYIRVEMPLYEETTETTTVETTTTTTTSNWVTTPTSYTTTDWMTTPTTYTTTTDWMTTPTTYTTTTDWMTTPTTYTTTTDWMTTPTTYTTTTDWMTTPTTYTTTTDWMTTPTTYTTTT